MQETNQNMARVIVGHKNAAQHHQEAAKAHLEAAKYHEEGNQDKANQSAKSALDHSDQAKEFDQQVAQHHGF